MLTKEKKEEAVRFLFDLVSIPSPSGKESDLAEFLEKWMIQHDFSKVEYDEVGNLHGWIGNGKDSLIYCGHMDTVPGVLPVRINGNFLTGRGSVDAKGALAAMLFSAHLLANDNIPLRVVCTVKEESDGAGIRYLLRRGIDADHVVFGEPAGASKVVIAYRGRIQLTVKFEAPSFHASIPWVGKTALQYAMDFVDAVQLYSNDYEKDERFQSISSCVTGMHSGVADNVAPPSAEVTFDIRTPPSVEVSNVLKDLRSIAASIATPKWSFRIDEAVNAVDFSGKGVLLRAMRRAIYKATGRQALLVRKTGSGDMNYLAGSKIEALTYGPGDPRVEHTEREVISLDDYLESISVFTTLPKEIKMVRQVGGHNSEKEI